MVVCAGLPRAKNLHRSQGNADPGYRIAWLQDLWILPVTSWVISSVQGSSESYRACPDGGVCVF